MGGLRRLVASLALALAPGLRAEQLGTIGPVYPIAEPHLLEQIMGKLKAMERSGELARRQQEAQARATDAVLHPQSVPGLGLAKSARTTFFDPSFTLARNVVDERGALLFAAGTTKNPLDVVALTQHLLFFDGRDPRQVGQARTLIDLYGGHVKPILVAGSYIELMKAWQRPVYFDQQGALVHKLGITTVPAIVSQQGRRLRIDELVLP